MKRILAIVLLVGLWKGDVLGHLGCDCKEYPVPSNCVDCCGVANGIVMLVTKTQVAISTPAGEKQAYKITGSTVYDVQPEEHQKVTIVFKKATKGIGLITTPK